MSTLLFDVAHLLAGGMLVLSFALLYQDRITAVINVFALQAITLSLSVAWQALVQNAPHLIVTAMIEAAAALKLVLYFSLIVCLFAPFGIAGPNAGFAAFGGGVLAYLAKLMVIAVLLPIGETSVAKMRVFRYPLFVGSAFAAAALAVFLLFVSKGF